MQDIALLLLTGLYLQIFPVSRINTMHWRYSRWVCVLFCLFVMFSFIHWLNYAFWRKKGSLNTSTQHQSMAFSLDLSHCSTEPLGQSISPAGVGSRNSTLLLGFTLVDSSPQPHHHTTHLNTSSSK